MSDGSWWPESEDEDGSGEQQSGENRPAASAPRRKAGTLPPLRTNKVHILGLQAPGKYLAFALSGVVKDSSVTLLTRRREAVEMWDKEGQGITLMQYGRSETRRSCLIDLIPPDHSPLRRDDGWRPAEEPISQLIVNTVSGATVPALASVRHRLDRQSTVLFMHNGLGVMEEVNEVVFPDAATRPNYMLANLSRSFIPYSAGFTIGLDSLGTVDVSLVPRDFEELRFIKEGELSNVVTSTASSDYLMRLLTSAPEICAFRLSYLRLLLMKHERVANRAMVEPLTTIFDCRNGDLVGVNGAMRLLRFMAEELSMILQAMPEFRHLHIIQRRLSAWLLWETALTTLEHHPEDKGDMQRDVRGGRTPDVKYVNGYFTRRATDLGINFPNGGYTLNRLMMYMVWLASATRKKRSGLFVPFASTEVAQGFLRPF